MDSFVSFIKSQNLVTAIIGGAIVWIFERIKALSEIQKIKNEILSIQIKSNESYYQIDQKRRIASRDLITKLKEIAKISKQNNAEELLAIRWEFIEYFTTEYIPTFDNMVKIGKFVYAKESNIFIETDIIPFLEASASMLEFINKDSILLITSEEKYILKPIDLRFAISYVKKNSKKFDFETLDRLNIVLKRLNLYTEEYKFSLLQKAVRGSKSILRIT